MKKVLLVLITLLGVVDLSLARPFVLEENPPLPYQGGEAKNSPDFKPPRPRIEVDPETRTITVSAPSAHVTLVNLLTGETREVEVCGFLALTDIPSSGPYFINISGTEAEDSILIFM